MYALYAQPRRSKSMVLPQIARLMIPTSQTGFKDNFNHKPSTVLIKKVTIKQTDKNLERLSAASFLRNKLCKRVNALIRPVPFPPPRVYAAV